MTFTRYLILIKGCTSLKRKLTYYDTFSTWSATAYWPHFAQGESEGPGNKISLICYFPYAHLLGRDAKHSQSMQIWTLQPASIECVVWSLNWWTESGTSFMLDLGYLHIPRCKYKIQDFEHQFQEGWLCQQKSSIECAPLTIIVCATKLIKWNIASKQLWSSGGYIGGCKVTICLHREINFQVMIKMTL